MSSTLTLTLDLHVHTNYSYDGHSSIEEIVKSAVAKQLDGIAICDHNTTEGSYAAQTYVADNHLDLIIIFGIEVTTSEGHLVVLGLEEGMKEGLSIEETIRIARQEEEKKSTIVIIAPHPFHPFRHGMGNSCLHSDSGIDAIEIFNSRYLLGLANKRTRIMAAQNGITAVVGSDAHSAECVGLATVEVEVEGAQRKGQEAILKHIKEGEVRLKSCKRIPFWLYLSQLFKKRR